VATVFVLSLSPALALSQTPHHQKAPPETPAATAAEMPDAAASPGDYVIQPPRVGQRPPTIDGLLNDDAWRDATVIDRFTQQEPLVGAPATERTEVRVLYDANHLYVGVRAYDSDPSAIIATEMRRDSLRVMDEDNFQIILDTFRDRRNGYVFVTNPLGAKLEEQIFEEGAGNARGASANVNRDWNGVWEVSARRTSDGWTAEIEIPMVTLR
jgi:hypothetical protein